MFWKIASFVLFVALVSVVCLYVWDDNSDMEKRVRDLELVIYDDALDYLKWEEERVWLRERCWIPDGSPGDKIMGGMHFTQPTTIYSVIVADSCRLVSQYTLSQ
ncbi:MAG: hypothetical protein HQ553_12455 [Chloroflexi bacterium]|nr:hypothetical protein [Chloroflexota bacterium]